MDVFHYTSTNLREKINSSCYDIVLMGFMVPRFKKTVREVCRVIKDSIDKNCWFVLGGYGPSAIPEYIIEETGADIICIGEADLTIIDLVKCKKKEITIDTISGIIYRDPSSNKIISNKRREKNKKLDEIPFPLWEAFPMQLYIDNLKFAGMKDGDKAFPIISSRGCTDRCSFCFRLESGIRARSVDNVIKEMKELNEKYGVNYYFFCDELAVFSKKRILQLTKGIEEELPGVHYRMDCRVTVFDDDIAKALKKSGCVFLNIGFESSSQKVLDMMCKRATVEQNIAAAELANKYGIGMGINIIWGMPGDCEESLRGNAEFIKKYNQYDQIRTIRPVTPYPGSPLYYLALEKNFLSGPQDFFNRFKNSDRIMVNFTEMSIGSIYKILLEVNTDLIYDHFKNTTNNMNAAKKMVEDLANLYKNEDYIYTGPRQLDNNINLRVLTNVD